MWTKRIYCIGEPRLANPKKQIIKRIELFILFLLPIVLSAQNNLIPDLDCSAPRSPFVFDISQLWSAQNISNYSTPLCGDIDGDGKVEVIVMGSAGNILAFEGLSGASAGIIATGALSNASSGHTNPYAICDVDGDGKAEIFVVNSYSNPARATLYTVTSAPGARPITFGTVWSINLPTDAKNRSYAYGAIPVVADLDGDGLPEFVAAYYIIRADGTMCPTKMNLAGGLIGASTSLAMCVSYAADLDNDGIAEIVVGTDVYKYNGTTATLWKRCPTFPTGREGTCMAADINLDGIVDLVYHDNDHMNAGSIVVWTPLLAPNPGVGGSQGVIGSIATVAGYSCYPVVGDIDGVVSPGGKNNRKFAITAVVINSPAYLLMEHLFILNLQCQPMKIPVWRHLPILTLI